MQDRARGAEQVRTLGEAAVAGGWRRKAAERVAPRVAGSAPVSGDQARAALGLMFLAMSSSYLLKAVRDGMSHRDAAHSRGPRAVALAGSDKGWRKAVADRVTPKVAARTPLDDHQARALLGAAFIGLSGYYVAGSVRRYLRAR